MKNLFRCILSFLCLSFSLVSCKSQGNIIGKVTCDGNPVKGVVISDGVNTVTTDGRGRYAMKSDKSNGYVFISIPGGYDVPADGLIPRHFVRLQLENTIDTADFELIRCDNENHTLVVSTDIHLTGDAVDNDLPQFHSLYLPDITNTINNMDGKVYSACLGDLATDVKWYVNNFGPREYLAEMAKSYPTPIYHIMGNHDNEKVNRDSLDDWDEVGESTYKQVFGPNYYSLNIGQVHYVFLDDIILMGPKNKKYTSEEVDYGGKYGYRYIIDSLQLAWLEKDLSYISDDTPLVVSMHVPFYDVTGLENGKPVITEHASKFQSREDVMKLFRRFEQVHLLAGHLHVTNTMEIADNIIAHNIVSASAVSWKLNDPGLPLVSNDGTPAGYQIFTVKGKDISWQFKGNSIPVEKSQFKAYDMNKIPVEYGGLPDANVIAVNVFNWDPQWKVKILEEGRELDVTQHYETDPTYTWIRKTTKMLPTRPTAFLPAETVTIFKAQTSSPESGIRIEVTDRFGNVYSEDFR